MFLCFQLQCRLRTSDPICCVSEIRPAIGHFSPITTSIVEFPVFLDRRPQRCRVEKRCLIFASDADYENVCCSDGRPEGSRIGEDATNDFSSRHSCGKPNLSIGKLQCRKA